MLIRTSEIHHDIRSAVVLTPDAGKSGKCLASSSTKTYVNQIEPDVEDVVDLANLRRRPRRSRRRRTSVTLAPPRRLDDADIDVGIVKDINQAVQLLPMNCDQERPCALLQGHQSGQHLDRAVMRFSPCSGTQRVALIAAKAR